MFNNAKVCLLCGSKMPCWDKKCKKGNERRGFRGQRIFPVGNTVC